MTQIHHKSPAMASKFGRVVTTILVLMFVTSALVLMEVVRRRDAEIADLRSQLEQALLAKTADRRSPRNNAVNEETAPDHAARRAERLAAKRSARVEEKRQALAAQGNAPVTSRFAQTLPDNGEPQPAVPGQSQTNLSTMIGVGAARTSAAGGAASVEASPEEMTAATLSNAHRLSEIERQYGELVHDLALPPEKRDALMALLLDKRLADSDVILAGGVAGASEATSGGSTGQNVTQYRAYLEQEIKALLGPTDYARYSAYKVSVAQTALVTDLAQSLQFTETPLVQSQTTQLAELLRTTGTHQIKKATIDAAASFLSPPQITALESLRAEQQATQAAKRLKTVQTPINSTTPVKSNPGGG